MEWQQIVGFYYVVKLQSFTRAAEATYRTQSALSQQIKNLEEELDCKLIERIGKKKLRLTVAGESLYRFSENLLIRYDHLIGELNEIKGKNIGRIRIAVPFTTLYFLLPKLINKFIKQFPQVELTLLDRPPQRIIELVRSGDVDFGVVMESGVPKDLVTRRWKKGNYVLMVPVGHHLTTLKNITIEQVSKYPLILPPRDLKYKARILLEEKFEELGVEYIVAMESTNLLLSAEYVKIGLGISFHLLAEEVQRMIPTELQFISLNNYFEQDYIAIVTRKDKLLTPISNIFLDILFNE